MDFALFGAGRGKPVGQLDLLEEISMSDLAREIALVWHRIIPTHHAGEHLSMREGISSEWAGVREKAPGERVSPSRINRRLSRYRQGGSWRRFVNRYESVEKERVTILADLSASIRVDADMFLQMLRTLGVFAYNASMNRDDAKVLVFDQDYVAVYEREELDDTKRLLSSVLELGMRGRTNKHRFTLQEGESALWRVAKLALQARPSGVVVLISDFLDWPEWQSQVTVLARGCQQFIPIILDESKEVGLYSSGMWYINSRDPETGRLASRGLFGRKRERLQQEEMSRRQNLIETLSNLSGVEPLAVDFTKGMEDIVHYCARQWRKKR